MLRLEILREHPSFFRSLTGLTGEEFEERFARFLPVWQQQERERLSRPDRRRAIGGGRKYRLPLQDRLLMTLLWLRPYWNIETLAFFFGVDPATVRRNTRRVLSALQKLGLASLGWPRPPRQGEGKTVEEVLEAFPDLLAIIDGTEQRIQRPQDDETRRQHSSGRRKAYTRKTIIVVDNTGRIRGVAPSAPGSQHDLKVAVASGLMEQIPESISVIGDAGFDGLQHYYPNRSIATPHKARRNHPLLPDQKLANQELASMRMVVEHTLSRLKRFRILALVFRHMLSLYDSVLMAVVGMVNFLMERRCQKAESVA
ncbi:MAG: transposase family protein [Anaerolineales bacterium]